MKLLPRPPKNVRVNTQDSLGHGMDAVIMLVLFVGVGYGMDRLLGTLPLFMIGLTALGSVGIFARLYYQYAAKMDQHDRERLSKLAGTPVAGTPVVDPAADVEGEAA